MSDQSTRADVAALDILRQFERRSGLRGIEHDVINLAGKELLIIHVASPTDRLFSILESVRRECAQEGQDIPLATIRRASKRNLLQSAEGKLLLRTLSESLNINRYSFSEDFFDRYTKSVFGAEEQITAAANHVVYGRRGAGKSSLLLYALHVREQEDRLSLWVDMQQYAQRTDNGVIVDVFSEILGQFGKVAGREQEGLNLRARIQALPRTPEVLPSIRALVPQVRQFFGSATGPGRDVAVFLDDFHVIASDLQPVLLGILYAVARGNNVFLKISAIETLTRTWDSHARTGLEIPHDAQTIKLDYNLTMPEKATEHVQSILNAHAVYCGLPSIRILTTSQDVMSRLVWVAAGVPRDALNLFSQAMAKATVEGRRHVSVTNVNVAASEGLSTKLLDLERDASQRVTELRQFLDRIKEFCIEQHHKNGFLVEMSGDDPVYERVRQLVDLRILHVINEGITVREAGRRYLALILDYGFYTGIRAARRVDLFNRQTKKVSYNELRGLPVLDLTVPS